MHNLGVYECCDPTQCMHDGVTREIGSSFAVLNTRDKCDSLCAFFASVKTCPIYHVYRVMVTTFVHVSITGRRRLPCRVLEVP